MIKTLVRGTKHLAVNLECPGIIGWGDSEEEAKQDFEAQLKVWEGMCIEPPKGPPFFTAGIRRVPNSPKTQEQLYCEALEQIAERRVLVMDDQGETVADALVKVACTALGRPVPAKTEPQKLEAS